MSASLTDTGPSPAQMTLETVVEHENWPGTVTKAAFAARIATALQRFMEFDGHERVVIAFADDARVQDLNKQFLGKDKPTNVLSFPALRSEFQGKVSQSDDDETVLGDVILAFETVHREAEEQGIVFEHHVAHLMIHGILHLAGYDHESTNAAEDMEALEIDILAELGIDNPYTEELIDAG